MLISIGQHHPAPGDVVGLLLECHARIRAFVELAQLIAAREDLKEPEVAEACSRVERYFSEALPLHVRDEEESVLPRLRGHDPEVDRALSAMHAQHEAHALPLGELLAAASALRQHPLDAATRARLATATTVVAREFAEHLALEETVLFPALRRLLPPATQAQLIEELRARRQP